MEHAVQAIHECFMRNADSETGGPLYLEPDELKLALSKIGWNIGDKKLKVGISGLCYIYISHA